MGWSHNYTLKHRATSSNIDLLRCRMCTTHLLTFRLPRLSRLPFEYAQDHSALASWMAAGAALMQLRLVQ